MHRGPGKNGELAILRSDKSDRVTLLMRELSGGEVAGSAQVSRRARSAQNASRSDAASAYADASTFAAAANSSEGGKRRFSWERLSRVDETV